MKHILVYSDSLSWGIIPDTRKRFGFADRWPGVMEQALNMSGHEVRVIEDCLNGRRTVFEDPFKPGRNGRDGLAQAVEKHSPLALVILMLGTNDFQSMHPHNAWHAREGMRALVREVRTAPIEPGMPEPPILIVAPPAIEQPKGIIAPKFSGGETGSQGLAEQYRELANELSCGFFDTASVTRASKVDGIHLDKDQHHVLGKALAMEVSSYAGES